MRSNAGVDQASEHVQDDEWTAWVRTSRGAARPDEIIKRMHDCMDFSAMRDQLRAARTLKLTTGNGTGRLTVDVTLLIDFTGSMGPYLVRLLEQPGRQPCVLSKLLHGVDAQLRAKHKSIFVRFAAAGYRDVGDSPQWECSPFPAFYVPDADEDETKRAQVGTQLSLICAVPPSSHHRSAMCTTQMEGKCMEENEKATLAWVRTHTRTCVAASRDSTNKHTRVWTSQIQSRSCFGGGDVPEDLVGALDRVSNCSAGDGHLGWKARARFCLILTDAPAHGYAGAAGIAPTSTQPRQARAPRMRAVCAQLKKNKIGLMFCSLNPGETAATEAALAEAYGKKEGGTSMLKPVHLFTAANARPDVHFIITIDESGSMQPYYSDLEKAVRQCLNARRAVTQIGSRDRVTIIQFGTDAHRLDEATAAPLDDAICVKLSLGGAKYRGATNYDAALGLIDDTLTTAHPQGHVPVVLFMTDGMPNRGTDGRKLMSNIRTKHRGLGLKVRWQACDFHV